jgi:hypothetical protein
VLWSIPPMRFADRKRARLNSRVNAKTIVER